MLHGGMSLALSVAAVGLLSFDNWTCIPCPAFGIGFLGLNAADRYSVALLNIMQVDSGALAVARVAGTLS